MEVLEGVDLSRVRVASGGDKVYKDECVYSFHTPVRRFAETSLPFPYLPLQEGEGGLYVSLNSLLGFSKQFVELNYRKTGDRLYLHIKKTAKPKVCISFKNACFFNLICNSNAASCDL